jgi:predicted DsbA family dithiol-disulfide isomerase
VLSSKQFEQETRDMEKQALVSGVVRVPTVVFDERHVVQGAQPPQLYAQTIRDVMNGTLQQQ